MRPLALAVSVVALLAAGIVAVGCGSSDSSGATTTATVPSGNLGASSETPILGAYGGVECGPDPGVCSRYYTDAAKSYTAYCQSGQPSVQKEFAYQGSRHNYVCFTTRYKEVLNFFYGATRIAHNVPVYADRFPETCQNGYCIQGEWYGNRSVRGRIRFPDGKVSYFQTEWIRYF